MADAKHDADGEARPWGAFLSEPSGETRASRVTGPFDWQLIQRDSRGMGRLALGGTWAAKSDMGLLGATGGDVQARLVSEETGAPIHDGFTWRSSESATDGLWSATLDDIPAGGPYRLETRFSPKGNKLGEWSLRGDMRHFLGVGDIWIVAGQSNAVGYGRAPVGDGPEIGLHVFRQDGRWAMASHPLHDGTGSAFLPSLETYNAGHSPFLHFARQLKRELGIPIGLIPGALGGSSLDAWHPESGPLFKNLLAMVAAAGGAVKGMVWIQGETDGKSRRAEDYLERFLFSVDGWRRALCRPDLPILTAQTGRYRSRNAGQEDREWSLIREAQRSAAHLRPGLAVVPALDMPLDDTIHFSSSGNLLLAERLARCALGAVYGRPLEWRAPEPVEAVLQGDRILEIRFAPVSGRLENHSPLALPWRVEDAAGVIPVEQAVHYRRDTVRITLARPVSGSATVSGGYGEDPDALPVDVERQLPVLSFHGFPIAPTTSP